MLEVGCWLGGTAATAHRSMGQSGRSRRYVCIDTFGGFVPEQFQADLVNGTPPEEQTFQTNSRRCTEVTRPLGRLIGRLVQEDIVRLPDSAIPSAIVACLLDVDLELPIYEDTNVSPLSSYPAASSLSMTVPKMPRSRGRRVGLRKVLCRVKEFLRMHTLMDGGALSAPRDALGPRTAPVR